MNNNGINKVLIGVFVFFLPFHYALTFNIGFPLKISEIAGFVLILLNINTIKNELFKFKQIETAFLVFLLWTIISFSLNIYSLQNLSSNVPSRFGHLLDSTFKLIYLIFVFLFFVLANSNIFKKVEEWNKNLFLLGLATSCLYAWYLAILSIQNIEPFLLPGMDAFPQHTLFSVGHYIRCGTFKEGNHYALLLLIGLFVAYNNKNWIFAVLFCVTIILTVSTMAIVCMFIFSIIIILKFLLKLKAGWVYIVIFSLLSIFSLYKLKNQKDIDLLITQKIIPKENTDYSKDWGSFSRKQRLNYLNVAYKIANSHPFYGVGISNYSLYYDKYNTFDESKIIKNEPFKRIVNNIYFEILAEQGYIGLIIFFGFCYILIKNSNLKVEISLILLYFFTYPSLTVLFVFYYFSLTTNKFQISETEN